jgi:hypothetical protein
MFLLAIWQLSNKPPRVKNKSFLEADFHCNGQITTPEQTERDYERFVNVMHATNDEPVATSIARNGVAVNTIRKHSNYVGTTFKEFKVSFWSRLNFGCSDYGEYSFIQDFSSLIEGLHYYLLEMVDFTKQAAAHILVTSAQYPDLQPYNPAVFGGPWWNPHPNDHRILCMSRRRTTVSDNQKKWTRGHRNADIPSNLPLTVEFLFDFPVSNSQLWIIPWLTEKPLEVFANPTFREPMSIDCVLRCIGRKAHWQPYFNDDEVCNSFNERVAASLDQWVNDMSDDDQYREIRFIPEYIQFLLGRNLQAPYAFVTFLQNCLSTQFQPGDGQVADKLQQMITSGSFEGGRRNLRNLLPFWSHMDLQQGIDLFYCVNDSDVPNDQRYNLQCCDVSNRVNRKFVINGCPQDIRNECYKRVFGMQPDELQNLLAERI